MPVNKAGSGHSPGACTECKHLNCFQRLPPLGVHVRHRVAHLAEQHQWGGGAVGRPAHHAAEGPQVHRGRDQRGRGGQPAPADRRPHPHRRRHARGGREPPAEATGAAGEAGTELWKCFSTQQRHGTTKRQHRIRRWWWITGQHQHESHFH